MGSNVYECTYSHFPKIHRMIRIQLLVTLLLLGGFVSSSLAEVDDDELLKEKFIALKEWLIQHDAKIGPITIQYIPGYGRGVVATEDIKVCTTVRRQEIFKRITHNLFTI